VQQQLPYSAFISWGFCKGVKSLIGLKGDKALALSQFAL
jgi:hypothetical protein